LRLGFRSRRSAALDDVTVADRTRKAGGRCGTIERRCARALRLLCDQMTRRAASSCVSGTIQGAPMSHPRSFSGDAVVYTARIARLELTPERAELVSRAAETYYALIDQLHEVALGETPPATAFDPRWES
jgi:hypothetical protein